MFGMATDASSQANIRKICLTVTDMRISTWHNLNGQGLPQNDETIPEFIIDSTEEGDQVFERLHSQVIAKFEGKAIKGRFTIVGINGVPITPGSIKKWKRPQSLVLFDVDQDTFPENSHHEQSYSITPHTRTATDQEGKFYGTDEQNPAAFALAELVDNALAAVSNNTGRKIIEVRYFGGANPSLHVLDNGCGMDSETLQSDLRYKAPKKSRINQATLNSAEKTSVDETVHPLYINSNISKFGAGMKQAIFYLGVQVYIMTKTAKSRHVSEVHLSEKLMEDKEKQGNVDPWSITQKNRRAREYLTGTDPLIQAAIKNDEDQKESFTHIYIPNIRGGNENSPEELLKWGDEKTGGKSPSIEKQLAHIYYYYLHGRKGLYGGREERNMDDENVTNPVKIHIKRFDSRGGLTKDTDLWSLEKNMWDLETQFVKSMTPNPFLFTIEVAPNSGKGPHFKVGGILRYHPFLLNHETHPNGISTKRQGGEEENLSYFDDDSGDEPSQCAESGKSVEIFQVWWNGRLIPQTKLESFDWCSPGNKIKVTDKFYKSYGRLSGSLFFDSNINEITENKLNINTSAQFTRKFNEKGNGNQKPTFSAINSTPNSLQPTRMKPSPTKMFEKWLEDCRKYDKQVTYTNFIEEVYCNKKTWVKYGTASWNEKTLKNGEVIKLINPEVLGRIMSFWVESDPNLTKERDQAPLSFVEIQRLPASCYEGGNKKYPMSRIDLSCTQTTAEEEISKKVEDLHLTLKILKWEDQELKAGDERNLDEILFKGVVFDVVNNKGISVKGCLPQDKTIRTKKKMWMVAMLHCLHDMNFREHLLTVHHCQYRRADGSSKGYFFTQFALNVTNPGDYVVSFRTYISEKSPIPASEVAQRQTCSATVASTYNVEWEKEVDELGRKILKEGIRLPSLEIFFKVLPGKPETIFMRKDVKDIRIGQGFTFCIYLKDIKKNMTLNPETAEFLKSQKPKITLCHSNHNFEVDCNRFEIEDLSKREIKIVDVVITGNLQGKENIECSPEISITFEHKLLKETFPIILRPGLPEKIVSLGTSSRVSMENMTFPKLAFHVVDCSGNILHTSTTQTPIRLKCQFTRMNDSTNVVCGNILCSDKENNPQILDTIIDIPEMKTGDCQLCTLNCIATFEDGGISLTSSNVVIDVCPNTKPQSLRLYITTLSKECEVPIGSELKQIDGEKILIKSSLGMKLLLFDGVGKQLPFDAKYKVKIDYPEKKELDSDKFSISVPTRCEYQKKIVTKLIIPDSKDNSRIVLKHEFFLTTYPLEPQAFKVSIVNGIVTVPIDKLPEITAKLTDQYDNIIKDFTQLQLNQDVEVGSPGILEFDYKTEINESEEYSRSFLINQLRIRSNNGVSPYPPTGPMELKVTYGHFHDTLNFNLIPGSPAEIALEIDNLILSRKIVNNKSLVSIRARLLDCARNITEADVDIPVILKFGKKGHWIEQCLDDKEIIIKAKTNYGNFGEVTVGYNLTQTPSTCTFHNHEPCAGLCFGKLFLQAECPSLNQSAKFDFHVKCRSDAAYNLVMYHSGPSYYQAGSSFEGLSMTLEAEDGTNFVVAKLTGLTLQLVKDFPDLILHPKAVERGVYVFGDVPNTAGTYSVNFTYIENDNIVISNMIKENLQITSGPVSQLRPCPELPEFLSVSNNQNNPEANVIVKDLRLVLQDKYGNICQQSDALVSTAIISQCDNLLENQNEIIRTQLELSNGKACIPPLMVLPNLNFSNNSTHQIEFTAVLKDNPQSSYQFTLEFTFYNNILQQEKIKRLTETKDKLNRDITVRKAEQDDIQKQIAVLNDQVKRKEQILFQLIPSDHQNVTEEVLKIKRQLLIGQQQRIEETRRGTESTVSPCEIDGVPEVLSKIGQFIQIKSETGGNNLEADLQLQRVLSWHYQNSLNVIVVETSAKALELETTHPESELVILDCVKDIPDMDWGAHDQLQGQGNPIYARSLLNIIQGANIRLVKKALNAVLGNPVFIDNLESATKFMQVYNQRGTCPTIITRDGKRLSSKGIVGGKRNTAPPRGNIKQKLGLAPSPELARIRDELGKLEAISEAVKETRAAKDRLDKYTKESKLSLSRILKDISDYEKKKDAVSLELGEAKDTLQGYEVKEQSTTGIENPRRPRTRAMTSTAPPNKRFKN